MQALLGALINLLQFLAAAVPGSWKPDRPAKDYLPDIDELKLAMTTAANREPLINSLLTTVKDRWTRAEAKGLITKLNRVREVEEEMSQPGATQPIPDVGEVTDSGGSTNEVQYFREYLLLDATGENSTKPGRDLVTGTTPVADVITSRDKAVEAVINLRRLDDVLIRALSCQATADATGTPLPQVLAMYRVEGDMNVPPSTESIALGVPSAVTSAKTSLDSDPDISHLVLLLNFDRAVVVSGHILKVLALQLWFVQIGGLDLVGQIKTGRWGFQEWSKSNWSSVGHPQAGYAFDRWDAMFNQLKMETRDTGTSSALMITPDDSEGLISGILQEAVMHQRALARVKTLLEFEEIAADGAPHKNTLPSGHPLKNTKLTPGMSYLHYHSGEKQMKAIMISAVVYASTTSGLSYSSLRSAIINDPDFAFWVAGWLASPDPGDPNAPSRIRIATTDELVAEWPRLALWLREDDNLGLLCQFVETAGGSEWPSWKEHRGNLSRYMLLSDYYSRL